MRYLRTAHRSVATIIVIGTLYLSSTGLMIQLIDLRSILTHAPADNPNVIAMQEAADGPDNYVVIAPKDYTAPALPQGSDLSGMMSRVMQSARMTVGDTPLRYIELRMADGKPVGFVESAGRLAQFDAVTGQIISAGPPPRPAGPPVTQFHQSPRNMFKVIHRISFIENPAFIVISKLGQFIVGLGLITMLVTGIVMYFKLLGQRKQKGPSGLFWVGAGTKDDWKRAVHRGLGLVASVFLLMVALSGLWLSYESMYPAFYMGSARQRADTEAFASAQRRRLAALPVPAPRPDPMSPEAEPGKLASLQQDIGLTPEQMVKVKAITDDSVKKNLELRKASVDLQEMQGKTRALHQQEANSITAVLTDDQKPRFQAWRDAQLLGKPVAGDGGGNDVDPSLPLQDWQLPSMLGVTLAAEQSKTSGTPIKVIRLRYYAGMPQGVIVTGGKNTKQLVFNASSGQSASETEPGYPPTFFPFGWQAHQIAKNVHRGGIIGLPGRFMDLFAGLSMLYLSINGIVLYVDIRKDRKREGHKGIFWVDR